MINFKNYLWIPAAQLPPATPPDLNPQQQRHIGNPTKPIINPVIAQACRLPHDQSHGFSVVVSNVVVIEIFSSEVSLLIILASRARSWIKIILLNLIFVLFLTPYSLVVLSRFGLYNIQSWKTIYFKFVGFAYWTIYRTRISCLFYLIFILNMIFWLYLKSYTFILWEKIFATITRVPAGYSVVRLFAKSFQT